MTDDDVPLTVDFRIPDVATTWAAEAEGKRPHRVELRRIIAARVAEAGRARVVDAAKLGILDAAKLRVLELGPGPGWLAETILDACDIEDYVCFDFSQPFLEMARARLGDRARYVRGDFLDPAWPDLLEGPFDAIVAMQSVHELRHKRRMAALYTQARTLMRPGSVLVVCDHEPVNPRPLCATAGEQLAAMTAAGLARPTVLATIEGMYVVAAIG